MLEKNPNHAQKFILKAGCVHFTSQPSPSACDIKVLILLYTAEKRAYLGFIPNDQTAFVDRLRKVIQHQKSTQAIRQGQGPVPGGGPNPVGPGGMGSPAGMSQMQPPTQQQPQQPGMMMTTQTNPMVMGGVQLTQNNVPGQMQPQMPMGQQRAMQPGFEVPKIHICAHLNRCLKKLLKNHFTFSLIFNHFHRTIYKNWQ